MEIWRDIQGYEGIYQVSNEGRVKSLERDVIKTNNGKEYVCHKKEVIRSPHFTRTNYSVYDLWKDNKVTQVTTHHLVAEAFLPNPSGYSVVHHIDEDPRNNKVENLMWMSVEDHRALHDNSHKKKVLQYTLDGELIKTWSSTAECGRNGYDIGNIAKCCSPKYKSYKTYRGYIWKYQRL